MIGSDLFERRSSVKILLISPFHGQSSHAAWATGWQKHSSHDVHILSLPDKGWSWRLKGGCVPLARQIVELEFEPDLIVATSLTCLSSLFGLLRKSKLSRLPTIYYMHENQLTYPIRQGGKRDSQLVLRQFHSQLTADAVWYNSDFNKREWLHSLPGFLKSYPDHQGLEQLESIASKSKVMPLGLELRQAEDNGENSPPILLWNQRWEWEKGTDRFCKLVRALGRDAKFRVVILGQCFHKDDPERRALEEFLGPRLLHSGWCERAEYNTWLRKADFTVSVARHEFFGISILEAAAHGVFTILPNDLAYPEVLPKSLHSQCLYKGFKNLLKQVKQFLANPEEFRETRVALAKAAREYDWTVVYPRYDRECEELVRG